jgi:hypothetical protein
MQRVAECHSANNVYLKRWRRGVNQQQWTYDCKTKTIRSYYWKNYAVEVKGDNNVGMTSGINANAW